MADVVLENICKTYGGAYQAITNLNLVVRDGEFLILVGPSGCGKSTALRMIAGLEDITSGTLRIGGENVENLAPKDRDIAMVFQNYALYPHMTVAENIAFSMRLAGMKKAQRRQRVLEIAKILQLEPLLDSKPGALSGGQRQRVAMGRAMVRDPSAFLMDEPLSNLDAKLRVQMRAEIASLQKQLGVTTIYVTHDQTEALTMGDRVAVMKGGVLQQVATPRELYDAPVNAFVAGFIGSPSMNLFEGEFSDGAIHIGAGRLPLPAQVLDQRPELQDFDGRKVIFGIRPEDLSDGALAPNPNDPRIPAVVRNIEELGSELFVHLSVDALAVDSGDPDAVEELGAATKTAANTVAKFTTDSELCIGDTIQMAVNAARIHFFDPATRLAIPRAQTCFA